MPFYAIYVIAMHNVLRYYPFLTPARVITPLGGLRSRIWGSQIMDPGVSHPGSGGPDPGPGSWIRGPGSRSGVRGPDPRYGVPIWVRGPDLGPPGGEVLRWGLGSRPQMGSGILVCLISRGPGTRTLIYTFTRARGREKSQLMCFASVTLNGLHPHSPYYGYP
jgi:hypothetical protein